MKKQNAALKNYFAVVFAVVFSGVSLMGCAKNESSAPIASRAVGPRGALASVYGVNAASLTGRIYTDASYQQQFQDSITGFLSTDVNPAYVGSVSATTQSNSGVFFGGTVSLSTGSIRTYTGSYAAINANSSFTIQVRDYTPQYPNATPLPPFTFTRAQGTLNGSQAQIVFGDSYGTITLNGTINQSTFDGEITYDNSIKFDGTRPGAAGSMGNFSIPICSFFSCN